ncbi:hypothetical protein SHVI106290_00700 [Shewanella violacea]
MKTILRIIESGLSLNEIVMRIFIREGNENYQ